MTVPTWVRGTLVLAVAVSAGVAVGIGYERRRAPPPHAAAMDSHHAIRRLTDELRLDENQQQAIAAIFARRQRTVDSSWHAVQPHVHATLDSAMQEILDVLRPDQAANFRKMVAGTHRDEHEHRPPPR